MPSVNARYFYGGIVFPFVYISFFQLYVEYYNMVQNYFLREIVLCVFVAEVVLCIVQNKTNHGSSLVSKSLPIKNSLPVSFSLSPKQTTFR